MTDQIFQASVGQVAGGDIKNHSSRWDLLPLTELSQFKASYTRERLKLFLGQYFNKAATLLVVILALFGWWGWHMIQTSGLTGAFPPERWFIFAAFAVVEAGVCFWLHLIRKTAKEGIIELDKDLRDIGRAIRFKKSKR